MIVTIGGLPVYDALILDEESGMLKISLVDDPAVMSNFQAFDNTKRMMMYSIDDAEKRIVKGVIMRADFPIYRRDAMGEYYIMYKADTIRTMAEKYLSEGRQNNFNLMHGEDSDVEGVQMVQFFIKDSARGIAPEGYEEIADGSLFGEFHVVNDAVWEDIKKGIYKGFSLEGIFDFAPEQDKEEIQDIVDTLDGKFNRIFKHTNSKTMSKLSRLKAALAKALAEFGNITTDKGILAWDGDDDLAVGVSVFIEDAEGNRIVAEDGGYTTEDKKVIVVEDGKVADIKDAEVEVAPTTDETSVEMGSINTDKGTLTYTEEEIAVGVEVFVEVEGEVTPAEDGEYTTEDGKTIVVVDGKVESITETPSEEADETEMEGEEDVDALKAENEALKAENEALKAELDALKGELAEATEEMSKIKKMSAAKSAHEEVTTSEKLTKTGVKGLDKLARILSAK